MGNWTIIIEGTGPHHNGKAGDADRIAVDLVKLVEGYGQIGVRASIITGFRESLTLDKPETSAPLLLPDAKTPTTSTEETTQQDPPALETAPEAPPVQTEVPPAPEGGEASQPENPEAQA